MAHCFLERPDEPAVAVYATADAEGLERELRELARGVVEQLRALGRAARGPVRGLPRPSGARPPRSSPFGRPNRGTLTAKGQHT